MEYIVTNFNTMHSILSNDNFSQTFIVAWQVLEKVFNDVIEASLEVRIKNLEFWHICILRYSFAVLPARQPKMSLCIYCHRCVLSLSSLLHHFVCICHLFIFFQKKKPPKYFSKLYNSFQNMKQSLCGRESDAYSSECLVRLEKLLKLHSMESEELVYQYHLHRCNQQQEITELELGILTVKVQFIEDKLKLEILRCNNLVAMDSNSESTLSVYPNYEPLILCLHIYISYIFS
jgi:hypothetical protein